MPLANTDKDSLIALATRRHPEYFRNIAHWEFCESTYNGGRDWFGPNIHRGPKEGPTEFSNRVARAYRFNHTREIVDLIDKYIFKSSVARQKDAADPLLKFWKRATLSGLDVDQFMRLASSNTSKLGLIWLFVDSTKTDAATSVAEEAASGSQIYAYAVKPQNILDVSFDDEGKVNWVLVRETVRDDNDPLVSSGQVLERFRLWMRDTWYLWTVEIEKGNSVNTADNVKVVKTEGENKLGEVPGFPVAHTITEERYAAPSLINDIAYLDKAVANYLSNIDAIIQDQTFSQLIMPAQNLLPGEDAYNKLLEMGTKSLLIYDGGEAGSNGPEYISPDPKQAGMILTIIAKIVTEIYHTVGVGGERTSADNAVGTDNSSGVAKAYDFERLNSLLVSKSKSLQNAENKLARLVMLYSGAKLAEDKQHPVKYADTFDVRSLYDEFTIAEKLVLIEAPDTVRREQMGQVVDKLFPDLAADLKAKMAQELLAWPKDPIAEAGKLAEATNVAKLLPAGSPVGKPASGSATKNSATANRQGEVTADSGEKAAA